MEDTWLASLGEICAGLQLCYLLYAYILYIYIGIHWPDKSYAC